MPYKRTDWPFVRAAFVEGWEDDQGRHVWPTLAQVSARFNVDRTNLGRRAASEGWEDERVTYQRRVEELRQEERAHELARIAADLDIEAVRVARDGMAITRARIQELGLVTQRRMAGLRDGDANIVHANPPVDAMEMDRLSRSADTWYVLGVKAIGLAPRERVEHELVAPVSADERDARTVQLIALMQQLAPELLPPGFGEVIDVGSHVQLVTGGAAGGDGGDADAEDQQLPAAHADH